MVIDQNIDQYQAIIDRYQAIIDQVSINYYLQ